jgi:hypothetical protein
MTFYNKGYEIASLSIEAVVVSIRAWKKTKMA